MANEKKKKKTFIKIDEEDLDNVTGGIGVVKKYSFGSISNEENAKIKLKPKEEEELNFDNTASISKSFEEYLKKNKK